MLAPCVGSTFFLSRRHVGLLSAAVSALLLVLGSINSAQAVDSKIGNTAVARNEVEQISAKVTPITIGDDVFMNEQVKTGVDSAAKFVFSDQTNLALGPTSTLKLDRFVFKGDVNYAKAAVNFTAGVFRFSTGGSDKGAYQLKTSTATIGVRGTIFEVKVAHGITDVTLIEGEVAICPRGTFDGDPRNLSKARLKQLHCQDLDQPNQSARITARIAALSSQAVNFAANVAGGCGDLCTMSTSYAALQSPADRAVPLDPNNPGLCYVKFDPD